MPDIQKLNVSGTDFDLDDPNDVEKEGGELLDTVINYDSATTPTIGSFTAFLNQFVSGTKVGQWFKNFRAGCDFLLHIGSLVNNCVTDNEALPLAAAQGKVLMDELTQLKSDLTELDISDLITLNPSGQCDSIEIRKAVMVANWVYIYIRAQPNTTSQAHLFQIEDEKYWPSVSGQGIISYVNSRSSTYGSIYASWVNANGSAYCYNTSVSDTVHFTYIYPMTV